MTVYAITDIKKGEHGLRLLIFKLPKTDLSPDLSPSPDSSTSSLHFTPQI